ncbi:UNVERIFIED_CONTAM: glycosyltransferase involved in cell wall biosynthesis [Brevibacillus sp. OAP136]
MRVNKLKVAVYAICKNEAQFVDRWMDSMLEADMVVVADTGSTDDTVERLRARGAHVYSIKVDPWRFDVARNAALNFIPRDVDVCVTADLDECMEAGWRKKLEEVWTPEATRLKYFYTWSFNPDGSRGVTFWQEKTHRRSGFRWVHPVHEELQYYGTDPDHYVCSEDIRLNHYPDNTKSRGQYFPLLEKSVQENPEHDRNVHYLGREYMYYHMWDKCIDTLKHHLSMPRARWKDERAASMRFIARAYEAKGERDEAKSWLYKAIAEAPHLREPYVEMAKLAYKEQDWPRIYHMVEAALQIKERPISYLNEPFSWDFTLYDLGALSCYYLGMLQKSLAFAKQAVEMAPDDERLQNNLKLIQDKAQDQSD